MGLMLWAKHSTLKKAAQVGVLTYSRSQVYMRYTAEAKASTTES